MKDMVTVTCYGTTTKMSREAAMKKYFEGMLFCEGSERNRYTNIYIGLKCGYKKVDDDGNYSN